MPVIVGRSSVENRLSEVLLPSISASGTFVWGPYVVPS